MRRLQKVLSRLVVLVLWMEQVLAFSLTRLRQALPLVSSSHFSKYQPPLLPRMAISGDESISEDEESDYLPDEDDTDDLLKQVLGGKASFPWLLPNSFELLLNQCCIQSFLFLVVSMRDPHTISWVEEFTQPSIRSYKKRPTDDPPTSGSKKSKLLSYHGLAALNTTLFPTWDSYFSQLLEQPKEIYIIESEFPHIPDYELEINPASLCSRIISVREQIAREFVNDLQVISNMGGHTLESYWEGIRKMRDDNNSSSAMVNPERPNLLFLEFNPSDETDYATRPSPLRKGNFDLLLLLATQESIHRVLNDPDRQDGAEKAGNQYLQNFYVQRLTSHFMGAVPYGRADDFLNDLLSQPPTMTQSSEDTTALIDPTRLAELILKERKKVALDWKEIAAGVPKAHMEIKRLQLNLLMGVSKTVPAEEDSFQ